MTRFAQGKKARRECRNSFPARPQTRPVWDCHISHGLQLCHMPTLGWFWGVNVYGIWGISYTWSIWVLGVNVGMDSAVGVVLGSVPRGVGCSSSSSPRRKGADHFRSGTASGWDLVLLRGTSTLTCSGIAGVPAGQRGNCPERRAD